MVAISANCHRIEDLQLSNELYMNSVRLGKYYILLNTNWYGQGSGEIVLRSIQVMISIRATKLSLFNIIIEQPYGHLPKSVLYKNINET